MTGTTPWQALDAVEPIQADTIAALANSSLFNTVAGCTASYSGVNMQVTIAVGSVTHNGTITQVAGNTVTLVSDPTNPRWSYIYINSSGVAVVVSGIPAAAPAVPDTGANPAVALVYVQAGLTVATNATYKEDKRVLAVNTTALAGLVLKSKSSTQGISTTTSFADVAAAVGTFSFPIAASETWLVEYWLSLTFGGTGGAKFQITGPATGSPVVTITGNDARLLSSSPTDNLCIVGWAPFAAVSGFSANIAAADSVNSVATASAGKYYNAAPAAVLIRATIVNGTVPGTVTLQAAQNSSNSTTTLGLGCSMRATRVS